MSYVTRFHCTQQLCIRLVRRLMKEVAKICSPGHRDRSNTVQMQWLKLVYWGCPLKNGQKFAMGQPNTNLKKSRDIVNWIWTTRYFQLIWKWVVGFLVTSPRLLSWDSVIMVTGWLCGFRAHPDQLSTSNKKTLPYPV